MNHARRDSIIDIDNLSTSIRLRENRHYSLKDIIKQTNYSELNELEEKSEEVDPDHQLEENETKLSDQEAKEEHSKLSDLTDATLLRTGSTQLSTNRPKSSAYIRKELLRKTLMDADILKCTNQQNEQGTTLIGINVHFFFR